ncbi:MAG: hypothetical protein K2P86_02485 [Xanthobacteraceae bacterium]|nr:hypothetical protein [Xanthobacteraceae bacterium]
MKFSALHPASTNAQTAVAAAKRIAALRRRKFNEKLPKLRGKSSVPIA